MNLHRSALTPSFQSIEPFRNPIGAVAREVESEGIPPARAKEPQRPAPRVHGIFADIAAHDEIAHGGRARSAVVGAVRGDGPAGGRQRGTCRAYRRRLLLSAMNDDEE